jgi:hypothetical protein
VLAGHTDAMAVGHVALGPAGSRGEGLGPVDAESASRVVVGLGVVGLPVGGALPLLELASALEAPANEKSHTDLSSKCRPPNATACSSFDKATRQLLARHQHSSCMLFRQR